MEDRKVLTQILPNPTLSWWLYNPSYQITLLLLSLHVQLYQSYALPEWTQSSKLKKLIIRLAVFQEGIPPIIIGNETVSSSYSLHRSTKSVLDMAKEIGGMMDKYIPQLILHKDLTQNSNVMVSRFILWFKDEYSEQGLCKAQFIMLGHSETVQAYLVYISPAVKSKYTGLSVSLVYIWSPPIESRRYASIL